MSSWDQRTIEPDEQQRLGGARPELGRVQREGRVVVTKSARGRGRTSLRREAEILDRLRLSGMVEMVEVVDGDDTTTLVMEDAGRRTLAEPIGLSCDEMLRALRGSCAAAYELHLAGWSHGSLHPDHVVLGLRGRARLCSFGAAEPIDRAGRNPAAADVDQLVTLICHVASLGPPDASTRGRFDWRRTSRRLRRIAADARSALQIDDAAVSADDLATALSMVDAPRHLRTSIPVPRSGRSTSGFALPVTFSAASTVRFALGFVVAAAAIAWFVVGDPGGSSAPARTGARGGEASAASASRSLSATAPPEPTGGAPRCAGWPSVGADVDGDGCPEAIRVVGNVVTVDGTGFRLGADGDLAAVGDWDCDGRSTARLLRPSTGELFEFPTWASTAAPSEAYPVTTVEAAEGLRSAPSASASASTTSDRTASCDRMLVTLQDGTEIEPLPSTPQDTP